MLSAKINFAWEEQPWWTASSLWEALLMVAAWAGACGSTGLDLDRDGGSSSPDAAGTGGAGGGTSGGGISATGGFPAAGGGLGKGGSTGSGGTGGASSTAATEIASGTVDANVMVGASTTSCQQSLRLLNPAQSLIGYLQMQPGAYRNDARAGNPSYRLPGCGKGRGAVPGPAVTYGSSSISASGARITTCVNAESACLDEDGYRVQVNSQLAYVVQLTDWEDEIALGEVELCMNAGTLTTQLVFAGIGGYLGGGVVHVTIVTILDGVTGAPTSPVAIEAR